MELSEEEKKAIETLKEVAGDEATFGDDISPKMAQNILNLINKQQKEIEKLKLELINRGIADLKELNNYISKDKIRELLETERMKALARFDNKLTVMRRIYKRNLQVSLIDKLKKELLDKN